MIREKGRLQYYEWQEGEESLCRWWLGFNDRNIIEVSGSSGNASRCFKAMKLD